MADITAQLKQHFIQEYVENLCAYLDDHLQSEEATCKLLSIKMGAWTEITLEILNTHAKQTVNALQVMGDNWHQKFVSVIRVEAPNQIVIHKPSYHFEDMWGWSNIQAYQDVAFIMEDLYDKIQPQDEVFDTVYSYLNVDYPVHIVNSQFKVTGRVLGIKDIVTFESDVSSSYAEFFNSIESYFKFCSEMGKQPEVPQLVTNEN